MTGKFKQFGLIGLGAILGVALTLNYSAIAERQPEPLPIDDLRAFTEVFAKIKSDYVEPVDDKKLINEAINGMLSGLDPHSTYLDPEAFKELQVGTQGEFGGLGIEVGMEDGFVKVVSPIEDTPAYKAGIKPGDLIIKLDETPVKGMTLNEAVKRMRGKPDTKITLTIARKGESQPIVVTLTRAIIHVRSVKSKLIEPGYGWVRVSQFQESNPESLVKHVRDLYRQGALKGLVLDLRNDPGGLLYGAVAVSSAFLQPNALVVSTDGRTEESKKKYFATPDDYLRTDGDDFLKSLPAGIKTVPLVVLVNGGSASASEIVAGALQDHKRATLIGTQTFGKGSVQTIMPLNNNTAIKLTTARYFTPSGRSIQAKGITPDLIVDEPGEPKAPLREADLQHHLDNDQAGAGAAQAGREKPEAATAKPAAAAKPVEFGAKDDFQLEQAVAYLKGQPVLGQPSKTVAQRKSGS